MSLLPVFPDFVPISIEHRNDVESFLRRSPQVNSEMCFTELFIWKHAKRTEVTVHGEHLVILVERNFGEAFHEPVGPAPGIAPVALDVMRWQASRGVKPLLYGASPATIEHLQRLHPDIIVTEDPGHADYVYRTEDLITLAGKKYDAKRNQIHQFLKKHPSWSYEPITERSIPRVLAFQDRWCKLHDCIHHAPLHEESAAVLELIRHYPRLPAMGLSVAVDGEIQAFTIGQELNPETAVVIVEKANHAFRGIYQFVNNLFCREMLSGYRFINREGDVNDPGLRRAKESYHPHHMVRKMMVTAVL